MVTQARRVAHKRKPLRRRGGAAALAVAQTTDSESLDDGSIVEHPDGWYWQAPDGLQEFGPFDTRASARGDRDRGSEQAPTEREAVEEAEQGVADSVESVRESSEDPWSGDGDGER